MRKNVLASLLCLSALSFFSADSNAQTLIYGWDFNGVNADSATHTPTYTVSGGGSASFLYYFGNVGGTPGYIDFTTPGSAVEMVPGDSSGHCIRFRNPADSVVFMMPTTGYQNIHFSYAEQRTNSGSSSNSIFYTVDGINWIPSSYADGVDSTTYTVDSVDESTGADTIDGWQAQVFNFNGDGRTVNNPHFAVAIVFNGVSTATSGNDRFDNVGLTGTTYISEGVKSLTKAPLYTLYPNPVSNTLSIDASTDGAKTIVISNAVGQKVYEGQEDGSDFSISTTNLNAGIYFISIRDNNIGSMNTMKFTKQ